MTVQNTLSALAVQIADSALFKSGQSMLLKGQEFFPPASQSFWHRAGFSGTVWAMKAPAAIVDSYQLGYETNHVRWQLIWQEGDLIQPKDRAAPGEHSITPGHGEADEVRQTSGRVWFVWIRFLLYFFWGGGFQGISGFTFFFTVHTQWINAPLSDCIMVQ